MPDASKLDGIGRRIASGKLFETHGVLSQAELLRDLADLVENGVITIHRITRSEVIRTPELLVNDLALRLTEHPKA